MSPSRFLVPLVVILGVILSLKISGVFESKAVSVPTQAPTHAVPTPLPSPPTPEKTTSPPSPVEIKPSIVPLTKIAFVSNRDGNEEVYLMNSDGTDQIRLTKNSNILLNYLNYASWSQDGNKIFYDFCSINMDGSDQKCVVPYQGYCDRKIRLGYRDAAWSPDGKKIAFRMDCKYNDGPQLYICSSDGKEQIQLTNIEKGCLMFYEVRPAFSPSGNRIAFTCRFDMYVISADGSNLKKPTIDTTFGILPIPVTHLAWSPNGKEIVCVLFSSGYIVVINEDFTQLNPLTNFGGNSNPVWSPDGKKIVFISSRDGNKEIYVMNADGTGQKRLTNNAADDEYPTWSPDGKRIAFQSYRDGNWEIYSMNADGSEQIRLTNNSEDDKYPVWSPQKVL